MVLNSNWRTVGSRGECYSILLYHNHHQRLNSVIYGRHIGTRRTERILVGMSRDRASGWNQTKSFGTDNSEVSEEYHLRVLGMC